MTNEKYQKTHRPANRAEKEGTEKSFEWWKLI